MKFRFPFRSENGSNKEFVDDEALYFELEPGTVRYKVFVYLKKRNYSADFPTREAKTHEIIFDKSYCKFKFYETGVVTVALRDMSTQGIIKKGEGADGKLRYWYEPSQNRKPKEKELLSEIPVGSELIGT